MPLQLLPKSAAAFAPRAPPMIVLDAKVPSWLTQTLKRINTAAKIKRPLHSSQQHFRCLTEVLGDERAIWTLCSLMLPNAPAADLCKDDDPLVEAISNYDLHHVQAYVVHVDMVSEHEVAYKLTTDSIKVLVDYHRDIYMVDAAASMFEWPEKDAEIKRLQEDFLQAANRFVFRTDTRALEGLEEGGAGELLEGRAEAVKNAVMDLFAPLLPPPPPRIEQIIVPAPVYTPYMPYGAWYPQQQYMLSPVMPADAWQVLPSTPSPSTTRSREQPSQQQRQQQQVWSPSSTTRSFEQSQFPSPISSSSLQDFSCDSSQYSSPMPMPVMPMHNTMPVLLSGQLSLNCGTNLEVASMECNTPWGYGAYSALPYGTSM